MLNIAVCRRVRILGICWLLLACPLPSFAQQFVDRVFRDDSGDHRYMVYVPANYRPGARVPAVLFLHGAGERGTDGRLPTLVGLGPYIKALGSTYPFLTVFPQAEATHERLLTPWQAGQPDGERALKILDEVTQEYSVDDRRIALVGWSMGGYGALSLGAAHPDRWSAVVALSGGGTTDLAEKLKSVPVWILHGARDQVVPAERSREFVAALKDAGGTVYYNEFAEQGHTLFNDSFGNPGFLNWLAAPASGEPKLVETTRRLKIEPLPFTPVLDIPGAVGVRLGNDSLRVISNAAPRMIPANLLSGRINDLFDSTSVQGRSFSVRFSGISYYGQIEQVQLQAVGKDRVKIDLGLRNITLTVGGTYINGARHSAAAGPIAIGIGHNRAVPLTIEVTPYVEARRLRLKLVGVGFSIPSDSYYVTQPAGVSVRGLGMTEDRVVNGIVSGLYGARGRVENEVRNIVPSLVAQLEQKLSISDPAPIVSGLWPLPVYQPRVVSYPEAISVDDQGISLVMGLTAASINPAMKPKSVEQATSAGVSRQTLGSGSSLEVAISPATLTPLTRLLIESDLAHINLLDFPEPAFAELADRKFLETIIPDLKRLDESALISAELQLRSPLEINPVTAKGDSDQDRVALDLRLDRATVVISVKNNPAQTKWTPYAEIALEIRHGVTAELQTRPTGLRSLALTWTDSAEINGAGRLDESSGAQDQTLRVAEFVDRFKAAWNAWTKSGASSTSDMPDLPLGDLKMRLTGLKTQGPLLAGVFGMPPIEIRNLTDETLRFEIRTATSAWVTHEIPPGEARLYRTAEPLDYRRKTSAGLEEFTLDLGSRSEFRVPRKGGPPRVFVADQ